MQARHGARRQRKFGYYIWSAERPVAKITPKQLESAAKKNHVAQVIFAVLIQSFLYARAPAAPLPAGARNIKSL